MLSDANGVRARSRKIDQFKAHRCRAQKDSAIPRKTLVQSSMISQSTLNFGCLEVWFPNHFWGHTQGTQWQFFDDAAVNLNNKGMFASHFNWCYNNLGLTTQSLSSCRKQFENIFKLRDFYHCIGNKNTDAVRLCFFKRGNEYNEFEI